MSIFSTITHERASLFRFIRLFAQANLQHREGIMQDHSALLALLRSEIASYAIRAGRTLSSLTIVAISKAQPPERIADVVRAGITDIGENYAQELVAKYRALEHLPIRWHFVGRLQTNKVKFIVPIVHLVHSVDRERLAHELDREAARVGKRLDILIQVNTSGEPTKGGVPPHAVHELLGSILQMKHLEPRGLMTLAGLGQGSEEVRHEFRLLRTLRDELAHDFGLEHFTELSMGMSSDYPIAIEEGATILRLGTRIFGDRPAHA